MSVLFLRLFAPGLLLAAVAASCGGGDGSHVPQGEPGEFITYQSEGIWVVQPDGSGQRRISNDGYAPRTSPDGRRIAFVDDFDYPDSVGWSDPVASDLFLIDSDGSGRKTVTKGPTGPRLIRSGDYAWSPDSKYLAFTADWDVWVVEASGSNLRNVTHGRARTEYIYGALWAPTWSPDSTRIAFAAGGLHVINLDGTGFTLVTTGQPPGAPTHEFYPPEVVYPLSNPKWSPDGQFFSYEAPDLWVVGVDGANKTRISDFQQYINADWSPDSQRLVASTAVGRGKPRVVTFNRDGSDVRELTDGVIHASHPIWSPEGTRIAFWSWDEDRFFGLFVMNADGSGRQRLTMGERFSDASEGGPPFSWVRPLAGVP